MFICEVCKKNPATVHLTDIHENQKQELHLCQGCAEAKGITFQQSFSLPELLAGLTKKEKESESADLACDVCGLHFSEFQSRGRLGCAHDYQAFRSSLVPMIERIHGKAKHMGKVLTTGEVSRRQQELSVLQRSMREAVEHEAYEEAAALRDRISRLREEIERERG